MVTVRAVYEGGHLRLLDPVELPDGQQVTVKIETLSEEEAIRAALGDLLVQWHDPNAEDEEDIDEEALWRIIQEGTRGVRLSDIIIQERDEQL